VKLIRSISRPFSDLNSSPRVKEGRSLSPSSHYFCFIRLEKFENYFKTCLKSQKRLIASQLKPRKGKDIKWILIENIYSLFRELFYEKTKIVIKKSRDNTMYFLFKLKVICFFLFENIYSVRIVMLHSIEDF